MTLYRYNNGILRTTGGLAGHQRCCPGYKLTQCGTDCPNTDCDGEATSPIYTTTDLSDYVGGAIKYDDVCWSVAVECDVSDKTLTEVTVDGSYDRCAYDEDYPTETYCCDRCYACGDCEFHPDSTISYEGYYWACGHPNSDCSGFTQVLYWPIKVIGTNMPRGGCNLWGCSLEKCDYYYDWEYFNFTHCPTGRNDAAFNWTLDEWNPGLSISYNCEDNEWVWNGCTFSGDCTGTGGWATYYRCDSDTKVSHHAEITITVSNNDCGAAGP